MTLEDYLMNGKTYREMLMYHNGYILALEDLKKDIDRFVRSGTYTGERMRAQIQSTLADAKRSRETVITLHSEEDTDVAAL